MTLTEKLSTIRILWRQPDLLTLWGIPYRMRPGQQPYDLWRAHRDWRAPRPGHYGSHQIDLSDWVPLGQPGWWGDRTRGEIATIEAFLARHKGNIPGNPCEWIEIESVEPAVPEGQS